MQRQARAPALRNFSVVVGLSLFACQGSPPPAAPPLEAAPSAGSSPKFIDDSFSRVYQLFLRRNLTGREKTARWVRDFKGKWVNWTAELIAFSPTGLKFRHIQSTVTFDVSVIVNQPQRGQLKKLLTVGKFYNYIARLDSYDDVFRTLYFNQGVIVKPTPEGVSGQLVPLPPPLPSLAAAIPATSLPGAPMKTNANDGSPPTAPARKPE